MADTPNLLLPYLAANQSQKHVTVNEALRRLDEIAEELTLRAGGSAPSLETWAAEAGLSPEQQALVKKVAREAQMEERALTRIRFYPDGTCDRMRVEITADGRVRLIDFKTARTPPSGRAVESDPQLATYQLAVQHGALGDLAPDPELAGATLVQLRVDASGSPGHPRVQGQSALDDRDDDWIVDEMAAALARVRAEDFPAVPSGDCRTCPYVSACPAQPEGREVLA